MTASLSRDAAWALLTEWTQGESLRKHALAVEAAVRGYARLAGEDETALGHRRAAARHGLRALSRRSTIIRSAAATS